MSPLSDSNIWLHFFLSKQNFLELFRNFLSVNHKCVVIDVTEWLTTINSTFKTISSQLISMQTWYVYVVLEAASMRSGRGLCVYTAETERTCALCPGRADSDQTWVRVGIQGLKKGGGCVSSIINGPYKGLITRKLHLMDCSETGGSWGCWTSGVVKTHTHTIRTYINT